MSTSKKKKVEPEKEKKKLKSEEPEEPKKKKKREKSEEDEPPKEKIKKSEEPEELIIDTKGKPIRLEGGGKLLFHCTSAKETGKKPSQFSIEVLLDGLPLYKSKPSTGTKWEIEDPMQFLDLPPNAKQLTVVLKEKGLVNNNYKGEVRLEVDTLYDGYPCDQWFDLKNKEGKDDKKIHGAIRLKVEYLGTSEFNPDVFKYPLHALIDMSRLDIFQKKIDDLQLTKYTPNDKKLTPLLHAAAEGKVSFVKVLLENKANFHEEKTSNSRNALHLAAIGGHVDVIRYLSKLPGVDLDAPDSSDLEMTALHLAAENNKADACTWLVKCGANPNVLNGKGNSALCHALMVPQPASSPQAIAALVAAGSDIYLKNKDTQPMCAWEISQRKDLCYSSQSRTAFMKATDCIDSREFILMETTGQKQRLQGTNLSKDWSTASQFIITVEKPTKVSILAYPNNRVDKCERFVAFCLVQGKDRIHRMPSFQQEGIGFGSLKSFDLELTPEFAYTVISYCTEDSVAGDFGICVFTKKGTPPVKYSDAIEWKTHEIVKSAWKKGRTAGGSADEKMKNPKISLKNKEKTKIQTLVMLRQIGKTVDTLVVAEGGHRITPSKYYVGFFIFDESLSKEITKTEKWINSYDVHMYLDLEPNQTVVVIPSTQKEKEEMEFEVHVYSEHKIELKLLESEEMRGEEMMRPVMRRMNESDFMLLEILQFIYRFIKNKFDQKK